MAVIFIDKEVVVRSLGAETTIKYDTVAMR